VSAAARALFGRLIDHAPTFPPAQLPVAEAIEEDRRARASEESWILARLAWPASKLAELGDEHRELTLIMDVPDTSGARHRTWPAVAEDPRVQAVEGRLDTAPDDWSGPTLYAEGVDLDRVVELGARAKIRCGGERVPSIDELAAFIRGCKERDLPFKATAGLHHAVRQNGAHGFLNVLAAAVFDEDALAEEDAEAFRVTETEFLWRDRAAPPSRGLFVSFGSCSFFEPVDELNALRLL
jgi:hypothetical protein